MRKENFENILEAEEDEFYGSNIHVYKGTIVKTKGVPKYHSTSQHNYYIRKKWECPYCIKGSIELIDVLYDKWMEERSDL